MALTKLKVTARPEEFDMVAWDGSDEAAQWAADTFPGVATVGGEPGARTLTLWGSWELTPGVGYMMNRWGSFQFVEADQIDAFQVAAPPIPAVESEPEPEQ